MSAARVALVALLVVFGLLWMALTGGCTMMFFNAMQHSDDLVGLAGFMLLCMSPGILCVIMGVVIAVLGLKKRKDAQ